MMRVPLYSLHHTFTHGGNYWRDPYLLEYWAASKQPVVYLNQVYNGYKLLLRLGNWCWLTKDPKTNEFMTLKFLSRPSHRELDACKLVRDHCASPYVSRMRDHFVVSHHLPRKASSPSIKFDAIVYPTTGVDLRRISSMCDHPRSPSPLNMVRRMQCIRHLVRGVTALHRSGIVHGDIHAGNVALPPPPDRQIEHILRQAPLVHEIRRLDGMPTMQSLPQRVTEPQDTGYGEGLVRVFDFGYSFKPVDGARYPSSDFPAGSQHPPELLVEGATTSQPFKFDSWQTGLTIYFILTAGSDLFYRGISRLPPDEQRLDYEENIDLLKNDEDEMMAELPARIRKGFKPILLSLLEEDPVARLSLEELSHHAWLMDGD